MELRKQEYFTYDDYLTWDDDVRRELIDGVIYDMAPPLSKHQRVLHNLDLAFGILLRGKKCRVYPAPFGVRIKGHTNRDTVLEPDLSIVCDNSKIDKYGCKGAPDIVVEILSPSSKKHDKIVKYELYRLAGVREYWIVDADDRTVDQCILANNGYIVKRYDETAVVDVQALEGCKIDLNLVFADID
jgi:Uma2 family endonuclease